MIIISSLSTKKSWIIETTSYLKVIMDKVHRQQGIFVWTCLIMGPVSHTQIQF